jgi:histidyl-tRNA synthetase
VQAQLMIKLFDRKEKLANEEFRDQAIDIFGAQDAPDGLSKIAAVMGLKSVADLPQPLAKHPEAVELENLFAKIKARGVTNAVFDITLMRGFDYYTGTVFEFFDTHPDNNRAMFGGGRYDGLVGLFGAEPITAVGVAPGLSMTELFLTSHQLLPDFMSTTEVYVVVLSEDSLDAARTLTDRLRLEGVNTELDITGRKLDRQIKTALKKRIPFMVFVGQDDVKSEMYNLKDTLTSKEEKLSFERIVSAVKDRRRNASSQDDDLLD